MRRISRAEATSNIEQSHGLLMRRNMDSVMLECVQMFTRNLYIFEALRGVSILPIDILGTPFVLVKVGCYLHKIELHQVLFVFSSFALSQALVYNFGILIIKISRSQSRDISQTQTRMF